MSDQTTMEAPEKQGAGVGGGGMPDMGGMM